MSCFSKDIKLLYYNNFSDSLVSLVSRLENSYNIEIVLEPIDIKISEAIMNFQENGVAISKKVLKLLTDLICVK